MSQNEESKTNTGLGVLAEVADVLAASAPQLREGLKSMLLKKEMDKRVDLLAKALEKRQQLFIEVKKLKPKMLCVLNEDGSSTNVPAPVTQDEAKKFKKSLEEANKKLTAFDQNLEKAFKADKDAFEKLAKQLAGKDDEPTESE